MKFFFKKFKRIKKYTRDAELNTRAFSYAAQRGPKQRYNE